MNKTSSAYYDFCNMIEKSWTFEKLTEAERGRCWDALHDTARAALKGTYKQRFEILHSVYNAFLLGLGYSGWEWRAAKDDEIPF